MNGRALTLQFEATHPRSLYDVSGSEPIASPRVPDELRYHEEAGQIGALCGAEIVLRRRPDCPDCENSDFVN